VCVCVCVCVHLFVCAHVRLCTFMSNCTMHYTSEPTVRVPLVRVPLVCDILVVLSYNVRATDNDAAASLARSWRRTCCLQGFSYSSVLFARAPRMCSCACEMLPFTT
jgi:hypothetical protein